MNVYLVERTEYVSWCQDDKMVVVAKDELHAERRARISSDYFRKAKNLSVKKIDTDIESVVLVSNTGA